MFELRFAFRGRTLSLSTNHQQVSTFAVQALEPLRCPPNGAWDHRAEIMVTGERTQTFFDGRVMPDEHYKDLTDILIRAFYATRDVFARFVAADVSSWACYGAALRLPAGAVLLLGPPTVGKTVLALHLLARGAGFYTDESFVIDRSRGQVEGVPRRVMLREPALRLLPNEAMREECLKSDDVIASAAGRLWYALDPAALAQRRMPLPAPAAPVAGIVLIDDKRVTESRLEAIHSKQGCMELARRMYRPLTGMDELSHLCLVLRNSSSFRLSLGEPSHAAELIETALGGPPDSGR